MLRKRRSLFFYARNCEAENMALTHAKLRNSDQSVCPSERTRVSPSARFIIIYTDKRRLSGFCRIYSVNCISYWQSMQSSVFFVTFWIYKFRASTQPLSNYAVSGKSEKCRATGGQAEETRGQCSKPAAMSVLQQYLS